MSKDPSRLRVALADSSNFGQATLFDLLMDEGVRDIEKFSDGRALLLGLLKVEYDLVLIDDELPALSATEIVHVLKGSDRKVPTIIALQSILTREEVGFLRDNGIGGVLLKPVAPKRFSAVFRSLFREKSTASLAA